MKTIDERIEEKGFWYDSNDNCCVDYTSVVELIEEQKKMDIDKAAELFREEVQQMKLMLNHFKKGVGDLIDIEASIEQFKKTMKQ